MLCFSINHQENLTEWCNQLASFLEEQKINATVFFSGKIIEKKPYLISYFGKQVDIGSQTYSYVNLTSITDFTTQLKEVQKGKQAVDTAGQLNSRLFKAPHGSTDENIYYILTQSNIIADFSYSSQYNLYENGQFMKYPAIEYIGSFETGELIKNNSKTSLQIVTFDNSRPISTILKIISELKNATDVDFVNASGVAGVDLTGRSNK
jgi:peptidoglycan/xylan/chitin deacetylase (PgdA/CDA1 family)